MLDLNQVSKTYDGRVILQPTTLKVPPGRTTALIGPSGCGKSTLLRIAAGLILPDAGTVTIDGVILSPQTVRDVRRKIGYVIQDGGLFPHLTAFDNTALLARVLGWPRDRIAARVEELADLTRLPKEALKRYPAQISGGQRQRVGIMRALMLDPAVVLLDEPMGALDPLVRYDLQDDLRGIFQTLKKTVLLVTHDMGEAAFFGDEVVLLGDGRIVQQGRPDDLLHRPSDPFVTRFLKSHRTIEVAP